VRTTPDDLYDDRDPFQEDPVDVRIGVTYSPKELDIELADDADPAEVKARVEAALGGNGGVVWITDRRGRQVGVPADKVAYVEIGTPDSDRRIGFGS
jgi:hypothetical protein